MKTKTLGSTLLLASAMMGASFATEAAFVPFTIDTQLTGDSRYADIGDLKVDVSIDVVNSTTANWTVNIVDILSGGSSKYPDIFMTEFDFNLSGVTSSDLNFSAFNPTDWAIAFDQKPTGAGSGNATFMFQAQDTNNGGGPKNPPRVDLNHALTFTATLSGGKTWLEDYFYLAGKTETAAGTGQMGAHIQGLTGTKEGSGFVIGDYEQKTPPICNPALMVCEELPEPNGAALLGIGLLGMGFMRIGRTRLAGLLS